MQLRAGWAYAFSAIHAAAEILGERFSSVVICWVGLVISSGLGWLCFRTERGGGYFVLLSQRRNDYRLVSIDAFSVHHYYKLPFSSIVLFCIFFSVENDVLCSVSDVLLFKIFGVPQGGLPDL